METAAKFAVKRTVRFFAALLAACLLSAPASAEPIEKLAKKLAKGLKDEPNKKVAVLDFPYPGGVLGEGSFVVQERLTTHLAQTGKVEVIERSLLKKVLEEMKLESTGVIDAETTKKLGKVLGVASLVSGTLNDLQSGKTEVNARVIEVETGRILAAGGAELKRTWSQARIVVSDPEVSPSSGSTPARASSSKPLVQVALLLDTSSSMDGLINQAKAQLLKVVNELASSEREGNNPTVQVALYEYGNDSLSAGENFIRQVLPFTADLDKVSEHLFALKTNGGSEYAGAVIKDALGSLQWSGRPDVYRTVFIAGNEPFTQGPVDFREALPLALRKGVVVNTIFCGGRREGAMTQWEEGARLGGGEYFNIDQSIQTASISAPQDAEIEKLGRDLNDTFVPMGARGAKLRERRLRQDSNASLFAMAGSSVERSLFKAAPQYAAAAAEADAVSELSSGKVSVSDLKREELPGEMGKMSDKELEGALKAKEGERKRIQERLRKLGDERRRFVAAKEKAQVLGAGPTLDGALLGAIRKQAAKKRLAFK